MLRQEFAYVAENLLLRVGYRKTHFQADQTTLQAASQMGVPYKTSITQYRSNYKLFVTQFTFVRKNLNPPKIFYFQEFILQSLIRHYLSNPKNLQQIFDELGLSDLSPLNFEVLGEKAFSEGHIDILIKESFPKGYCKKMIVEIKVGKLQNKDIDQLQKYMDELGEECIRGVLIGRDSQRAFIQQSMKKNIHCFLYSFENLDLGKQYTFEDLLTNLKIKNARNRKRDTFFGNRL